jgi:hypothetical protein
MVSRVSFNACFIVVSCCEVLIYLPIVTLF